ncbi:hypothetical protein SCA6_004954 [Theobroma cacao]
MKGLVIRKSRGSDVVRINFCSSVSCRGFLVKIHPTFWNNIYEAFILYVTNELSLSRLAVPCDFIIIVPESFAFCCQLLLESE